MSDKIKVRIELRRLSALDEEDDAEDDAVPDFQIVQGGGGSGTGLGAKFGRKFAENHQ